MSATQTLPPRGEPGKVSGDRAEDFYFDWECACNLCEDETGGSIHGGWVRGWMLDHGWTEADLALHAEYEAAWRARSRPRWRIGSIFG